MIKFYSKNSFAQVAKGDDEMWNWLYDELYATFTYNGLADDLCLSPDDMVQEVFKFILERKERYGTDIASEIYEKKDSRKLLRLVRERIAESTGEKWFDTDQNYRRYKKVHAVCQANNIPEDASNSWMIWGVIDDKVFTISLISLLLQKKKPKQCSYDELKEAKDKKLMQALEQLEREYDYQEANAV